MPCCASQPPAAPGSARIPYQHGTAHRAPIAHQEPAKPKPFPCGHGGVKMGAPGIEPDWPDPPYSSEWPKEIYVSPLQALRTFRGHGISGVVVLDDEIPHLVGFL